VSRSVLARCPLRSSRQRFTRHRLTDLNTKPHSIPKGVRLPSVDWTIQSLQIQQGNFIVAKIRNATQTSSPAPMVRFTAMKKFQATQSPPNNSGDTTGSGGSMSAIIADVQPAGASAGQVLDVQPYAIPNGYLECSEITADVDFKRAFPDTNWTNNKVTIKTKCGAAPATVHQSPLRPV
jgi:hypothetical protein